MGQLLQQAPELLHNILLNVDTTDLASLSSTCRYLNGFIRNDELLWRLHYLSGFVGHTPLQSRPDVKEKY